MLRKRHRPASSPNAKWNLKGFAKLGVFLAFLVLIILLVLKIAIVPKTPATAEQTWDVLVAQGYEPQDITEWYFEKDEDFIESLIQCIAIEKDDIHFEFFVFKNKDSAIDLYSQAYTKIILAKNAFNIIETGKKIANYSTYTLDDKNTYNVAIYVENTAIYAYSKSENKNEINKILFAIDYFD